MSATFNRQAIQAAGGQVYVAAVPPTVTGTTTAAIVKELFGKFFEDGDIRGALLSTQKPWTIPTSNGFKTKVDSKNIETTLCTGDKITLGRESLGFEAELTVPDMDPKHLADLLSASAAHILTLAKSATQDGRETFLGGGQRAVVNLMVLYRFPGKLPGTFRHVLLLNAAPSVDGDIEHNYNKPREAKAKFMCEPFDLLPDPDTGQGVKWLEDYVTELKG